NVHYSELADFFHVWLRLGLEAGEPAFTAVTTRSGREVQGTSAGEFGEMLGDVFKECVRVLKPGGLLAFTLHPSGAQPWWAVLPQGGGLARRNRPGSRVGGRGRPGSRTHCRVHSRHRLSALRAAGRRGPRAGAGATGALPVAQLKRSWPAAGIEENPAQDEE